MSSPKQRPAVVVVGNGMVGYKLCEYLIDSRTQEQQAIVCFGEEHRPAYDRVRLTSYFSGASADDLLLADAAWYRNNGIDLHLGDPVVEIDREAKVVHADRAYKHPASARSGRVWTLCHLRGVTHAAEGCRCPAGPANRSFLGCKCRAAGAQGRRRE